MTVRFWDVISVMLMVEAASNQQPKLEKYYYLGN
jgi:hypothetical protein